MPNLNYVDTQGREVERKKLIRVEVAFGEPKKKCRGSGICRIVTAYDPKRFSNALRQCNKALGYVIINKRQTELHFFKYSLCSKMTRPFIKPTFQINEQLTCNLPIEGTNKKIKVKLERGNYPIHSNKHTYSIVL
ncbi:MAG: hypothetical protein AAFO07_19935 [Bacteroidota bacterium]